MVFLLAAGCGPDDDRTFPPPLEADAVVLHDERTWSEPATIDQHHATVAVLADGGAAVTWSDGLHFVPGGRAWVRALTPRGVPSEPPIELDAAPDAGKADVIALPDGRVLVAYQTAEGLFLSRVDLDARTQEIAGLAPADQSGEGSSVDLALRTDGIALAVWYDRGSPLGTYRSAARDAELAPVGVLPEVLGVTEDVAVASADIDVDPAGRASVTWVDQTEALVLDELFCTLYADGYDADGVLDWRVELGAGDGPDTPRRPTAVAFPDGRLAVGWRTRAQTPYVPVRPWLGFLDADGGWVRDPFVLVDADADDVVLTRVRDDALWVVWTAIVDPETGVGTIEGGLLSFPEAEWLVPPQALSASAAASRPHTDANVGPDGAWRVAVSWEEVDDAGIRSVHGRTGRVRSAADAAPID